MSADQPAAHAQAKATGPTEPELSVIVPARNEAENLRSLLGEIAVALDEWPFEILVVDDGSDDHTAAVLAELRPRIGRLRHIRHDRSAGQSAAVRTGLLHAAGDLVLTLDGDGQNDPAYFRDMIAALERAGAGTALVAGQRVARQASYGKRLASRSANGLRARILKDGVRDTGCGLKCVRRSVFLTLPYFDGWHRYLPALVLREGHGIALVDVVDRPRRHGTSKYGILDRALVGALDLFGVWWLRRRRRVVPLAHEVAMKD